MLTGNWRVSVDGPSDWCRLWSVFAEADARMKVDANRRVRNEKGDISVRAALRLVGWDSTNVSQSGSFKVKRGIRFMAIVYGTC